MFKYAKPYKDKLILNSSYLDEIISILEDQNLNYRLLDTLNVTESRNFKCFYILIEGNYLIGGPSLRRCRSGKNRNCFNKNPPPSE